MIPLSVQQAITQAYDNGDFELPTAHAGFEFQPPLDGGPYARCLVLSGAAEQRGFTVDKLRVLLQIDLIYPPSEGSKLVKEKADQICAYFVPHRLFSRAGQNVTVISRVATEPKDTTDAKQRVVITVTFRAAVDRIAA